MQQSQKYLEVQRQHSIFHTDSNVACMYDRAFEDVVRECRGPVSLVGLGCGGGPKEAKLLAQLKRASCTITSYIPVDVSSALLLAAREKALEDVPTQRIHPLVCDLGHITDLPQVLRSMSPGSIRVPRIFTAFGLIPNFDQGVFFSLISSVVQEETDTLMFSANLAPGHDFRAGMDAILPQYDNEATREWLLSFILGLGIAETDGQLAFSIVEGQWGLWRVEANFIFCERRQVSIDHELLDFHPADQLRVFHSYRHTPETVARCLDEHGLELMQQWVSEDQEEGVFAVKRSKASKPDTSGQCLRAI